MSDEKTTWPDAVRTIAWLAFFSVIVVSCQGCAGIPQSTYDRIMLAPDDYSGRPRWAVESPIIAPGPPNHLPLFPCPRGPTFVAAPPHKGCKR